MSKIGKKPIIIPEGVEVNLNDGVFLFKGKNGELSVKVLPFIKPELKDKTIVFGIQDNFKQAKANWGTMRSLAQNAVAGVSEGFSKSLIIEGIGCRAAMEGNSLVLSLGLSHPVKFNPAEGIKISVEKNIIKISGADKELVGRTAANIRALKKPEPYKGKGIRYENEVVRRKAGKKVAGTTK
jgi:large subunit ribosomal protein L6